MRQISKNKDSKKVKNCGSDTFQKSHLVASPLGSGRETLR